MRETETAIVAEINCDVKWDEWEKQVNAQIESGLTVKEWCRQNRVNEKTYYSLISTAQANGMDAEKYLTELFSQPAGTIIFPWKETKNNDIESE